MFDINYLTHGYDFLVFPSTIYGLQFPMEKFKKDNGIFYSVKTIEDDYQYIRAVHIIDSRFMVLNICFSNDELDDERNTMKDFLVSQGLVNMRVGVRLEDIDYSLLNGNEFGIFSAFEIETVPQI